MVLPQFHVPEYDDRALLDLEIAYYNVHESTQIGIDRSGECQYGV